MALPMKQRNKQKKSSGFYIYGRNAVISALKNKSRKVNKIFVTDRLYSDLSDNLKSYENLVEIVDNKFIADLLDYDAIHQGIACEVSPLTNRKIEDIYNENIVVMLDQVTDPHNVGAIMRSAAAFNVGAVIVPNDNAPSEGGVMARASCGAMDILPYIRVTNLVIAIKSLKENGFWIIGLDGYSDTDIGNLPDYDKVVLVLGSEGKGMRPLTKKNCDLTVKLPISSKMESLNVSNAAAISFYELSRR